MLKLPRFRWLTESAAWQRVGALGRRYPKTSNTALLLFWWCALNLILNLRAPVPQATGAYLLPSIDSALLLGLFALIGMLSVLGSRKVPALAKLRVPAPVHLLLGLVLLVVRVFRFGDGIARTFQSRPANLFIDAPMLSELGRLLYTTMPLYQFVLVIVGILIGLPLLIGMGYLCCSSLARVLRQPLAACVFAAIVATFCLLSLGRPSAANPDDYVGAFAPSLVPRLKADYTVFSQYREAEKDVPLAIAKAGKVFAKTSGDLKKLQGANVLLVVVESYGATLLTNPFYTDGMKQMYDTLSASFDAHGYHYASTLLDSPTNGGYSWLAHATLLTGVRVTNQAYFNFVNYAEPKGLVHFFKDAGYRTVSAEPGTTRKVTGPDLFKFDVRVSFSRFNYKGPRYSWAPMPDQLVMDKIHRGYVVPAKKPLFIKYALVSSHGPWNLQPPYIEDWSKIKDGEIYNEVENVTYPTSWTNLGEAQGPYLHSIQYSMEVIRRYLEEFVKDGSLVIILGDHQPTGQITNQSTDTRIPIHIVSRNQAFIDKFIQRGYIPGIRPDLNLPASGMETFPANFLEDFSDPRPPKKLTRSEKPGSPEQPAEKSPKAATPPPSETPQTSARENSE